MNPQPDDPLRELPAPLRDQILAILGSLPIGWRVIQVRKDAGDWVVTIGSMVDKVTMDVILNEADEWLL